MTTEITIDLSKYALASPIVNLRRGEKGLALVEPDELLQICKIVVFSGGTIQFSTQRRTGSYFKTGLCTNYQVDDYWDDILAQEQQTKKTDPHSRVRIRGRQHYVPETGKTYEDTDLHIRREPVMVNNELLVSNTSRRKPRRVLHRE